MISECFGQMARANVDDIHSDHLPVILIVFKVQGSVNVRNIIQGVYGVREGVCSMMGEWGSAGVVEGWRVLYSMMGECRCGGGCLQHDGGVQVWWRVFDA